MRPKRPEATRVYLVGSHATGKTTLARWVRDHYGLPMIAEVARGVLAEMEARLDSLRADVDLVGRYQKAVFDRQIEAERKVDGAFVSDRAFCNLAYAGHHSTIMPELFRDPRLAEYMNWVRGGLVFFLRPHRELVQDDGVRAGLEWEEVVRIDGMVKLLLEMFGVPYIPVESLAMQERVRLMERVLDLAGLDKTNSVDAGGHDGSIAVEADLPDQRRAAPTSRASSPASSPASSSGPIISES